MADMNPIAPTDGQGQAPLTPEAADVAAEPEGPSRLPAVAARCLAPRLSGLAAPFRSQLKSTSGLDASTWPEVGVCRERMC
jgi:hypothetical protein